MCAEYPGNEFKDRAKPRDGLCVQNIVHSLKTDELKQYRAVLIQWNGLLECP